MTGIVAAVVAAATSIAVTVMSLLVADRQRRHAEQRSERQRLNARYLNPLRMQVVENHYRLEGTLRRLAEADPADGTTGTVSAMLVIDDPAELSTKDSSWFNGIGCPLVTAVYMTASLFAQIKQVREDMPYLLLSGRDDTELACLILRIQRAYLCDDGVYYVTQPSLGEELWIRPEGRLRTYREFCQLLTDPASRIWFDRLVRFHLQTAQGERTEQITTLLTCLNDLGQYLDRCVGGGDAIAQRVMFDPQPNWAPLPRTPLTQGTSDPSVAVVDERPECPAGSPARR
ncbi:MAG: hypothetical protein JXA67_13565 [Micromonosporaceae bacterium]|nr:hypothetical protein [Micromonosporaceae bacterium]